jgi:hypothetical protein
METAVREVSASGEFDLEVVNGDRETARQSMLDRMQSIIQDPQAPKDPKDSKDSKGESSAERT